MAFLSAIAGVEGKIYNKDAGQNRLTKLLRETALGGGRVIFLTVACALFIFLSIAISERTVQIYRLRGEISQLNSELKEMEDHHQELLEQRDYVSSQAYVEKVAREELGLVKPGEKAVVIVSDGGTAPTPQGPSDDAKEKQPFWRRWSQIFSQSGGDR